ncbi:hypothetical protein AB0G42_29115, partial [Streptomyces yangpuensis]
MMRLRRQIEAQTHNVATLSGTNMGDPVTGLTKSPDLLVMADEDTDDTAKAVNGDTGPSGSESADRPQNAEKPRTMTGAGLSHNDCSAASYSPTGSPLQ